jgi:hypothetical protein
MNTKKEFFIRFNNIVTSRDNLRFNNSPDFVNLTQQNVFQTKPNWDIFMDYLLPVIVEKGEEKIIVKIDSINNYLSINNKQQDSDPNNKDMYKIYIDWHDYLDVHTLCNLSHSIAGSYGDYLSNQKHFTRMSTSTEIIVDYDKILEESLKIGNNTLQIYQKANKFIINIDADKFIGKLVLNGNLNR